MWIKVRAKVPDIPEELMELEIGPSDIKNLKYVWTDKCIWSDDIKDFELYGPSKVLVRFNDDSRIIIKGNLDTFLALLEGDDNPPSEGKIEACDEEDKT